ncbi:histidine kinase [Thalassobaculum fulvum]|uniref:Sensor protein FixL n=1 Tax=Thalassobaculum fulvum TaxID=1633335 RepID=A0A918XWX0_9PROT|nr:PAS domain-containing sensor histidine kinase [Thalassobaculum fulvum]GHD61160.1 histidine kinase [Thalassobaculum fulvum]
MNRDIEIRLEIASEKLREYAHALDYVPAFVRAPDGTILIWTSAIAAVFGWSEAEAVGRKFYELLRTVFPAPLETIEAELFAVGEWKGEMVHRHRDGRRITVESQWAVHRDPQGKPVSILQFVRDVTEAKRAQSMIEEREARLRSVLDTAPDAIITIDGQGIVQSFSHAAERLFGYAAGEVIGRNINLLMPSPHAEAHDGYLERYLRTGEKRIIGIGRTVQARRRDGGIFPIELAVGEVVLPEGRVFTGFIRDISARQSMEEELRQAHKMEAVGQLTGGVAHDFNNLLTVISGNLELLERRLVDDDDRDILREAQEAADLGAQLASRLLAFGRRQPLNPKPIDLNAMVVSMVDLLRRTLGETVRISTRLGEAVPVIMVDPGQVENALLNLSINARDAMPDGGTVTIETGLVTASDETGEIVPGTYVKLTVSDTGVGMPPEVRQRAFEPFFTTKGPGAGSGLGLSMVYGFAKQSGGHVDLHSQPGKGTAIGIYLPVREEDLVAADVPGDAAGATAERGRAVLVVEDDPRVRRVAVRRLHALGYRVLEADSGPAALTVLGGDQPVDILFSDVVMAGGMSGFALATRALEARPDLQVVLTSGYTDPAMIREGQMPAGARWLAKPYTLQDLEEVLRPVVC